MLSDRCPVCPVCDVGVLWPNGLMDQDETWHAGRSRPRSHCIRWGLNYPLQKGGTVPNFWIMPIVAKRSPISATAEHLFCLSTCLSAGLSKNL